MFDLILWVRTDGITGTFTLAVRVPADQSPCQVLALAERVCAAALSVPGLGGEARSMQGY